MADSPSTAHGRAAGREAVIRRRGRQSVLLEEVPAEQRAPIFKAYLGENTMIHPAALSVWTPRRTYQS